MDFLTIEGGRPLRGTVKISGAKNAALPILIATLLTDDRCLIQNVPQLKDIETVIALLVFLGKKVECTGSEVEVTAGETLHSEAPYELVRKMRASVVVLGPLLARFNKVKVSLPGGCAIGGRPIDIHLEGFKAFGAEIQLEQGYVDVHAKVLRGNTFHLPFASVGATENLMMAATLIQGKTVLQNAAREPEITDLADMLIAMGARIQGAGTETITIEGVKSLHGVQHHVIADRIETGTYMVAAAMTGGVLTLENCRPEHLTSLIDTMRQAQIPVEISGSTMKVSAPPTILPVSIETAVYPGFPTDLQAQWMVCMALSNGRSQIVEQVFENRFMHVAELQRMGANIQTKGNSASITGVSRLSGADVMVSDLRAGAALVLAGLAAEGRSTIHRVYHLDRGYEALEAKLSQVGAIITRGDE
jgi:UDP-N-acetylglucosamine 1-carboxyvinyltransferase